MNTRIIIIGGGFSGLSAAHELLKNDGLEVVLLEASNKLGGLSTFFRYGEYFVDQFYHCIMPTDSYELDLIKSVGLEDQLYWKKTKMGFIVSGKHYAFNSAMDLIRFRPISFFDRLRLGAMSLSLRKLGEGKELDKIRTETWLRQLFGENIWDNVWNPLFQSKFGSSAGDVPAIYLWQRIGREGNVSTRGYLRCGLKGFLDEIGKAIEERGGQIRLNAEVKAIQEAKDGIKIQLKNGEKLKADWAISTIPMPILKKLLTGSSLEGGYKNYNFRYQGVVNVLIFLSRALEGYYWIPVFNSNTEFDGVVEMSALVNPNQYGGQHLVYLMKYCEKNSDLFNEPKDKIIEKWTDEFLLLYRNLNLKREDILDVKIFRAPFVEPIYSVGYMSKKPNIQVGESRLLLSNSAQVYPDVTSINWSVRLARKVVGHLLSKLDI